MEYLKSFFNVIKDNDVGICTVDYYNYFKYKGSKSMYMLHEYLVRKKRYVFAL